MHYLNHVVNATRCLGPLRYVSARPMKRSTGLIKDHIKSRQKPSCNAFNYVLDHFGRSKKEQSRLQQVEDPYTYKCQTNESIRNAEYVRIIGQDRVRIIKSYQFSKPGQKISIKHNRVNSVIFEPAIEDDNLEELMENECNKKYGKLKLMYNDGL